MTNSNQLFELAQLAEASYAEFDKFSNDIIGALKAKNFSKTQAEDFADNWAVVDHQPNTGNGYSGTLFEYIGDDPNSGFTQGQQVFAQRGTEPTLEDASADIHEISQNGLAFRQIIDMYNYWQRLIAADGATVSEARLVVADIVNLPMDKIIFESIVPGSPFGAYWTIDFEDVAGAGLGKVNTSNLAGATGHSLGGHLADAFSRLFGAEALTINGAGYATGLLPGLGLTAGYNIPNLFAMLGGADKFPAQYINNLFGDKMPEFVTQNGPGLYQAGGHNALFIEQDSWYENTLGHGSSQMTDSLAVANLFIKLDASLATQAPAQVLTILNSLMEKSSNQVAQSLEKLVESLSEILLGNKPTITTDDRESLYVAIKAITDNPVFTALAGKVTLSATIPSTSEARNDLSAFLSLYYLTPFTLKESVAGVLDSIYMNHGTLAQQWNDDKDLTPEQIANGEANFSDMYLNDRAAMLSWVNKRNKKDDNKTVLDDTAPNALFRDKNGGQNAQGTSLYTTEIRLGSGGDENRQHFIFGANDDADTLTGSSQADHLYGMAGADTLNGDKGNDWLEGGADNDTLNGGEDNDSLYGGTGDDKLFGDAGNDHLYGGTDNDTLKGGKGADQLNGGDGNDTLEGEEDNDIIKGGDGHDKLTGGKGQDYLYGGDGNDTYTHNAGDGTDVIIDSDGQGSIKIKGGTTLNGGAKKEGTDNVWQSADKETQYALHDQGDGKYTLNILLDNGEKIFVKDWVNNQLGINLEDGTPPDVAVLTPASDYYEGKDADAQQDGGDGNDVLVASTHEKATLKGGAGNDLILGTGNGFSATLYNEDKSDSVTLQTNDDWKDINASWAIDQKGRGDNVYYYAGSPYTTTFWKITGTDPDAGEVTSEGFIYAGGPSTQQGQMLFGDTGNDLVAGTAGADYIDGGDDDDYVYGNHGDDVLFGGKGKDYIFAGDGNDTLDGGSENDALLGGYGNDVISGGSGDDYLAGGLSIERGLDTPPYSTNYSLMGNDVLDGGAGNDQLFGGAGSNMLYGGEGDDKLVGSGLGTPDIYHGDDYLDGGDGNDDLFGEGGSDTLLGGKGSDLLKGDDKDVDGVYHGKDYLDGGEGDDFLNGGGDADTMYGGAGNDELVGDGDDIDVTYHGKDYLDGGDGDDKLWGSGGNDVLIGGLGDDQLVGDQDDDTLDGGEGTDSLYGSEGNDILFGGAGDDFLNGEDGDDNLEGGAGEDTLKGGAGADYLDGGSGADALDGGDGDDTLMGGGEGVLGADGLISGGDLLAGGAGNDTYYAGYGDVVDDTQGHNTIVLDGEVSTVEALINDGWIAVNGIGVKGGFTNDSIYFRTASGAELAIEDVIADHFNNSTSVGTSTGVANGGKMGDVLYVAENSFIHTKLNGAGGDDVLTGGRGDDTLLGGVGNDQLNGGQGNDKLIGGVGNDIMTGGLGNDVYEIDSAGDFVAENNAEGQDRIESLITYALGNNFEDLTLVGTTAIDGVGNELNNHMVGNHAANILNGGFGNDALDGMAGDDTLNGEMDNDTLNAGDGDDVLNGGIGDDIMIGSVGNDVYTLALGDGFDLIEDTQGLNQIHFGAGITPDSLRVSQYQGDDGNYYLLAQYGLGDDRVAIRDGLVGGIQSYHFDDGTIITHADLISADGLPLHIYGTQNADTIVGFIDADVLEGGAGDDELIGLEGNDTLLGGVGSDLLNGGMGDDLLDGGFDNDQLEGGAGVDSYLMRWGMGQDNVIDGEDGELNSIILETGINLEDITSRRNANDLLIRFRNSEEGLLIKDYYAGNQQWDIRSASGETTTVTDFLANPDSNQTVIEQAISNYKSQVKSLYYTTLGKYGFSTGADGLLYKTVSQTWEQGKETTYYVNEFAISTQVSNDNYLYSEAGYESTRTLLSHSESTIKKSRVIPGYASTMSGAGAGFHSFNEVPPNGGISYQIPDGASVTFTDNGFWIIPSSSSSSGGNTTSFITDSSREYSKLTLSEIQAGFDDNQIYVANYSVVDAGGGNDQIYAGGSGEDGFDNYGWEANYSEDFSPSFGYGSFKPTDRRNIGALLYGNDEDDFIGGSDANDQLIGGSGNDYMDGMGGADTYFISADESGTDVIVDRGHSFEVGSAVSFGGFDPLPVSRYMDWYFRSIGVSGWGSGYVDYDNSTRVPVISSVDDQALAPLFAAGVIEKDIIEFGTGITLDNISVSWDETVLNWQGDEYNMYSSAVSRRGEVVPEIKSLYISWGNGNGVKVGVPDMNDNTLADLIASGENWGLGWGIEQFKFADGTVLSMQEMIDLASPAQPVFEPLITFNLGSGNVTVSYVGPEKYVQMDFNSSKADFILTQDGNDLLLTHVNGFDQLRIQNRNQDTLSVFFKDGGYQLHGNNQLVNYGFNGDDIISSVDGFNNTSLIGQGGNDAIYGDSSNQTLIGGSGNDQLYGGAGSDLYMVDYGNGQNVVHGHDVIYETEQNSDDIDVVSIAAPVDSISLARNQEDLVISYGQYGDTITLAGWYAANGNAIEFLNFTDDTSWGKSTLVAMAPVAGAVNHAPLVMAAITLQTATEDALFSFTAPANAFSDEDAGDTLSYNTTLLDGSALPSWLSFDKSTLTFSGTPGNDHVGNISLTLTVTDLANASASQNFDLNVINSNDVPIVVNTIANTQVTDGSVFNWTLPTNIFIDVDQGDQLSYTLSQADGGALPNWLSYDAQTQTLSGTPSASDIGDLNIKVTAMDSGGAIAETGFNLNINAMPAQEVTGGNINDTIIGGSGNDELDGGAGNDIINGGYGDDALTGGTGSDLLLGGEGNDTFLLSADGTWVSGYGVMNAGSLGHAGSNQFISITGRIASADAMDGGPGYDVLLGTSGNDIIVLDDGFTASPNGYQPRFNSIEAIRAGDGDDIIDMTSSTFAYGNVALEGNAGNDVLWASSGDDLLDGGIGNDRLDGGWGNDILLGGDGNDTLFDRYRHNLLDGGTGNDVITAGSGRDIIIGGQGDDIITIGTGYDVIVFNKGDGQDTISAPTGADNTISLGGNFAYSDLSLTKSTNNLILKVGVTDQITLKDWYLGSTNKSVINLQVIAEAVTNFALGGTDALRNNKVENFNFANLVTAFDADVATNAANATNWQLTDARLTAHLQAGSDTAAIGGDLAYQYGRNSNLTGMGLANAQSVIAAASFGQTAQTLNNPSVWQAEVVKLG